MVIACRFSSNKTLSEVMQGILKVISLAHHTLYAPYFDIKLKPMFAPWVQENHALTFGLTMANLVTNIGLSQGGNDLES